MKAFRQPTIDECFQKRAILNRHREIAAVPSLEPHDVKEQAQPFPKHFAVPPVVAQATPQSCATALRERGICMINYERFPDLPPDTEQQRDEAGPPERRASSRPKATFQWPPDCLWPFIDGAWEQES